MSATLETTAAPKKPPRKASKAGRWRALALLLVHVAIALHVAHWMTTGETISPLEPSEGMEFSKHGVINAGLIFFLVMIVTTAIAGRFFCGWACHLIAVQDACTWLLKKLRIRPKPFRSKALIAVPMIAFLYMFVYPFFARWWLTRQGVPLEAWQISEELTTAGFWDTFPDWPIAVLTLLIGGFGIVYFLGNKGFCTYMCPYGAILGVADRFSPWRIRVSDACEGCGHCTAACTSNVMVHAEVRDYGTVMDAGCMRCLDCVSVCPNDALSLSLGAPGIVTKLRTDRREGAPKTPIHPWRPARYGDYSWREEVVIALLYAAYFFTFRGLYTQIPFLFALAIAGILAFLTIETWRMLRQPTYSLPSLALKRGGHWTGKGRAYLAVMAVLLLFSAHSAFVRWNETQRDDAWHATAEARFRLAVGAGEDVDAEQRAAADRLLASSRRVDRYGLVPNWRNTERLAWGALFAGDPEAFETEIRRALRQSDGIAQVHADYGQVLESWGRLREAEAHLRLALESRPGHAHASRVLGVLLARTGRLPEAEAVFTEGVEYHPGDPLLWHGLGTIREERGRRGDALAAYAVAVELAPGYVDAWIDLASARLAGGDAAGARQAAAEARRLLDEAPELALAALPDPPGDPRGRPGGLRELIRRRGGPPGVRSHPAGGAPGAGICTRPCAAARGPYRSLISGVGF